MSGAIFSRIVYCAIVIVSWWMGDISHAMDFISTPTQVQKGIPDGYSVTISTVAYDTAERQTYRMEVRYGSSLLYATEQRLRWRIESGGYARFRTITPDVDMITSRSLGWTDCDMQVNWGVYWCYNYGVGSSYSSQLFNRTTGARLNITHEVFVNGAELAIVNGGNVEVYRPDYATMTLGEKIRTVARPTPAFGVMPEHFPVLLTGGDGSKGYVYRGTDGKSYAVSADFTVDVPLSFPGIDLSGRSSPIGKIGRNGLIVSREDGGGTWYAADTASSADPVRLDVASPLSDVTIYENPRAYFRTTDGRIVSWDRNCRSVGYNSCSLLTEGYACTSEWWQIDPSALTCGGPVTEFSLLSSSFGALADLQSVSIAPIISLRFASMPDIVSFLSLVRLRSVGGMTNLDYNILGFSSDAVILQPRRMLVVDTDYELVLPGGLVNTTGVRLGTDTKVAFRTGSWVSSYPGANVAIAPVEVPCTNGACNLSGIRKTQEQNKTQSQSPIDTQSALDPVELSTLEFTYDNTLLSLPGAPLPYSFDVSYRSRTYYDGVMGFSWDHSYNLFLTERSDGSVAYSDGRLGSHVFHLTASGTTFDSLTGLDASLEKHANTGLYSIRFRDGRVYEFASNLRIARMLDANGNVLVFGYNASDELATVTDSLGRLVTYEYASHRLSRVIDSLGRSVEIGYYHAGDAWGGEYDLASFLLRYGSGGQDMKIIGFTYDTASDPSLAHNIRTMTDAHGVIYVSNTYDTDDRIVAQTYGSGSGSYEYVLGDLHADDTDTTVGSEEVVGHYIAVNRATNRRGIVTEYTYDRYGSMLSRSILPPWEGGIPLQREGGLSGAQTSESGSGVTGTNSWVSNAGSIVTTYAYDANHRLVSETLPLGNGVTYAYDTNGNKIEERRKARMTDPDGENDLVTRWEYDLATDLLRSKTMANGLAFQYVYDDHRNLVRTDMVWVHTLAGASADRSVSSEYDAFGRIVRETDGEGRTTVYAYDASGNIATVTRGVGDVSTTESYTYDAFGNMTGKADGLGNTTSYLPDAFGRIVRSVTPEGVVSEYVYDGNDNRTSERVGSGSLMRSVTVAYDLLDHPIRRTESVDATTETITETEYDGNENVAVIRLPDGTTKRYAYDLLDRRISETIESATGTLLSETHVTYDANGNAISFTDALGRTTTTAYDGYDRPIRITDPLGNYTLLTYDRMGNVAVRSAYSADGIKRVETRSTYDELSQVLSETSVPLDANGAQTGTPDLVTSTEYDRSGLVTATVDALGARTTREYDSLGRLVRITDPLGNRKESVYDARGLVTESRSVGADGVIVSEYATYDRDGRMVRSWQQEGGRDLVTSYTYDALGRPISVIDPLGQRTDRGYDLSGRLLSETRYDGATPITTHFAYDALGRRTSLTDAKGNVTTYAYDPLGRLIRETSADGAFATYAYDTKGNLVSKTDPNGTIVRNTYDSLDRLTHRSIEPAPGVMGVTSEDYAYDSLGHLTSADDSVGSFLTFVYDSHSRLISESQNGRVITSEYDLSGRRIGLALPSGQTAAASYDPLGRLTHLADTTGGSNIADYSYSGDHLTRTTLGNATHTDRTYDSLGRLGSLSFLSATGATMLPTRTLGYDARSQIVSNGADLFSYDALGRLAFATEVGTNGDKNKEAFAYDPLGNRTTSSANALTNTLVTTCKNQLVNGKYQRVCTSKESSVSSLLSMGYTTNTLNQYAKITGEPTSSSVQTLRPVDISAKVYDRNGNLTDNGKYRFSYDYRNRLVRVVDKNVGYVIASYAYDPLGRRTTKTLYRTSVGSYGQVAREIRYASSGDQTVEEAEYLNDTASGTLRLAERRSLVYGPLGIDDAVAMIRTTVSQTGATDRSTAFFHTSENGSVLALSSATGTILEAYRYDAFGRPQIRSGNVYVPFTASALGNSRLFTAREYEPEAGLYSYRARHYDPLYGRFLQRDPIGTADDVNLYTYVKNDPVGMVDPMGTRSKKIVSMATAQFNAKWKQMEMLKNAADSSYLDQGTRVLGGLYVSAWYEVSLENIHWGDMSIGKNMALRDETQQDSNIKANQNFTLLSDNYKNCSPDGDNGCYFQLSDSSWNITEQSYLADIGNMALFYNWAKAWFSYEYLSAVAMSKTKMSAQSNWQDAMVVINNEKEDANFYRAGYNLGLNTKTWKLTQDQFKEALMNAVRSVRRK